MAAWTDIIAEKVQGSHTMVSSDGEPFVQMKIARDESIELYFVLDGASLPFHVWFKRRDTEGNIAEERLYVQCGTRDLAAANMLMVADLRLNSLPMVMAEDGE